MILPNPCDTRLHNVLWGIPVLLLGLLLAGCGTKSFPRSLCDDAPSVVQDLQAQVRLKRVELQWSVPGVEPGNVKKSGHRFSVLKSEIRWENRNCLECPVPMQHEIQRIEPPYAGFLTPDSTKISFADGSVEINRAYRYQVALLDKRGAQVTLSNPVIVKVMPAPGIPRELLAAPENQGILLQWKPPVKDEHGRPIQGEVQFAIERHAPDNPWERVTSIPIRGNLFLDPAVTSSETYDYRVIPLVVFEGTSILGEPASILHVKAPGALPPPPPNTVWVIPGKGSLEVHWTEHKTKVGGYHVYRREGKEIIRLTAGPIQHPPYVDKSVKKNNVYHYAVSAVGLQADQREGLLSKWAEIRALMFE
ncbi:MAG TPA: hypothetical protein PLM79_03560 [Syntrophobacteraceae bacterium]|nr:hypothetical protein [Syntrophobacteraceae bacterium]